MAQQQPVTPHAYKKARSLARQCQREYEIRRALYLATRSVFGRGSIAAREAAIDNVMVARQDRDIAREVVARYEERGVQVGAAWSPLALDRVREAAAKR